MFVSYDRNSILKSDFAKTESGSGILEFSCLSNDKPCSDDLKRARSSIAKDPAKREGERERA